MNILFLANPNSIHDWNWIRTIAGKPGLQTWWIPCLEDYRPDKKAKAAFESAGIHRLPGLGGFDITRPWAVWRGLRYLRRTVREKKIDVLHILYADPNAQWAAFARGIGVPVVVTTRGSDVLISIPRTMERSTLARKVAAKLYVRAFERAAAITCTSERQADAVRELFPRSPEPLVVRTGVDVQQTLTARPGMPLALPPRPFVFFPRAMGPLYNHELAVEAIALLPENLRRGHGFVFVNADAANQEYVSAIREKAKVVPGAEFVFLPTLGPAEMFHCYRQCRLVVMTPKSDGTPVSALEAMLLEKPIVFSPIPLDPTVFGQGIHFLQGWTPEELSETMAQFLTGERQLNLAAAKASVLEHADRAREMDRLVALYERVMSYEL